MAKLPVDPKLSRILIAAQDHHCLAEALVITTALSVSDVRQRPAEKRPLRIRSTPGSKTRHRIL